MKKVLLKVAAASFVVVAGLAFVACQNNANGPSPSSSSSEETPPPAERLDEPVGAENPFRGKNYANGSSSTTQYRFKDSDERIVELWSRGSTDFGLQNEMKYSYNTEQNTLTLALNKYRTSRITDESIDADIQQYRNRYESYYLSLTGGSSTNTDSGSSSSSGYSIETVLYTYGEYRTWAEKRANKMAALNNEYIAKFEALLNNSQYADRRAEIEEAVSALKNDTSFSVEAQMKSAFGNPQVFKYAVTGANLTLTAQWPGKFDQATSNWAAENVRLYFYPSYGSLYASFSGSSSGNFSINNCTIANGTISGTYYKYASSTSSSSGTQTREEIPVSLAYSTTGSGNDTKLKINFTNAPDDLKALVENAAELEFSYVPTVMTGPK
ncbi:MAG: hypothetical protein II716_12510 [Treponema sp.]|nr:hypothetical protein [Treponema sp.]